MRPRVACDRDALKPDRVCGFQVSEITLAFPHPMPLSSPLSSSLSLLRSHDQARIDRCAPAAPTAQEAKPVSGVRLPITSQGTDSGAADIARSGVALVRGRRVFCTRPRNAERIGFARPDEVEVDVVSSRVGRSIQSPSQRSPSVAGEKLRHAQAAAAMKVFFFDTRGRKSLKDSEISSSEMRFSSWFAVKMRPDHSCRGSDCWRGRMVGER